MIIGKHGLKIARGNRQGLLLPVVAVEHGLDAEGFLQQVCRKAGLPADAWQDDDAALMTFRDAPSKVSSRRCWTCRQRSRGRRGPIRRHDGSSADGSRQPAYPSPPAARSALAGGAGTFYPGHAEEIDRTLDGWFAHKPEPETWAGALVPHAGWVYSGRLAADVFSRVKFPKQVIVLAPRHRPEGTDWAVAPHRTWQLPGRCLDSDPELARTLAEAVPGLELDAAAHANEHAIEVQLPLIARLRRKAGSSASRFTAASWPTCSVSASRWPACWPD